MTNTSVWQIDTAAAWYTRLNHRVWTLLELTLGVWPVASDHNVAAVWTTDGWQTANWTPATWMHNAANSFGGHDELWKARLFVGPSRRPVRFWYAIYVQDSDGVTHWDNNNGWNYEEVV